MFRNGKFNGQGQLYSADGKLLQNGQFENNEFIG
jgi:antitoxin component YwqK of YwqJK toxin-antitoxin module